MKIPYLPITNTDAKTIARELEQVATHKIACVNWPEEYPDKPQVSFRIAHNGNYLFLQFAVEEQEILALVQEDFGPVWTDSCVEFFVAFDNASYYNAEFSCIGNGLINYRPVGGEVESISQTVMNNVKRFPSLGSTPFNHRQGDFNWNLLLAIPVEAYARSGITSFSGLKARGNFYKCGDNLTRPHFLSWKPIDTPEPNFHVPQFFGDIEFEAL